MTEGIDDPDAPTSDGGSQDHDNLLSWGYAANLNLDRGRAARSGPALEEYQRRFTDYADTLLRDLGADAGRLSAVIAHHRDRLAALDDATDGPGIDHLAIEIAEAGLARIHAAGADSDLRAHARLIDQLEAQFAWSAPTYRQGLFHRHRAVRRLLRRVSPSWWLRRVNALRYAAFEDDPSPDDPRRTRRIVITYRGVDAGRLDYRACAACRIGWVAKLTVDEELQGRGIGNRALAKARACYPGYQWCTSGQYTTARTFWAQAARRSGERYLPPDDQLRPCSHIEAPGS